MDDCLPSWRRAALFCQNELTRKNIVESRGVSQNVVSSSYVIYPHVAKLMPVPVPAGVR